MEAAMWKTGLLTLGLVAALAGTPGLAAAQTQGGYQGRQDAPAGPYQLSPAPPAPRPQPERPGYQGRQDAPSPPVGIAPAPPPGSPPQASPAPAPPSRRGDDRDWRGDHWRYSPGWRPYTWGPSWYNPYYPYYYPPPAPVWVPGQWVWNGWQWMWQPGYWRYY